MENLEKGIEVSQLIVKDLQGCISPEEKVMLDKWLEESPENREVYHRVQGRVNRDERQRIIRQLNKRVAWERVDRNTKEYKHSILRRCMRYAATIVLPLFVVGIGFYLTIDKEEIHPVAEVVTIAPGVTKAELVLADGHKVILGTETVDSLASERGVNIVKDGNGVSYFGNKEEGDLAYNIMRVPRGGEFKVRLQDGTLVYMNSETELKYPVRFNEKERTVYLSGEAYFEVTKDSNRPFYVVTEEMQIRVYGTEFNVNTHQPGKIHTVLVGGKVGIKKLGAVEEVSMKPGQLASFDRKEGTIEVKDVDVRQYVVWKDGYFTFENESLEQILNTLSLWYDVDVFYMNQQVKDYHFSAWFKRSSSINEVINILEKTKKISLDLKGRILTVKDISRN